MQFQVPQFIETEDKIIGPLSLRQFIYIGGAFGISVVLYFVLQPWLWFITAFIIVSLGAAFAFIKINGQPLAKIVVFAARFYFNNRIYVWKPEEPHAPKNKKNLEPFKKAIPSIEKIIAGLSLKRAREKVLTGTKTSVNRSKRIMYEARERYEIINQLSGSKRAAKRVDYP